MTRLPPRRRIVPIDLGGSPHRCVVAPPVRPLPTPDLVTALIDRYHEDYPDEELEIAFYQGGVPSDELLAPTSPHPIRLSCNPADFTRADSRRLAEAGAEAVELEALSFEPHVLRTCKRGYKSGRVITMAKALAEMEISVGIHLSPGLPGTDPHGAIADADRVCSAEFPVDFVRIWPALGFDGSRLGEWARTGQWAPWGLQTTIETVEAMMDRMDQAGIPVVRVGLQPGQDIPVKAIAGPVHPNLRGEVEARRFRRRIQDALGAGVGVITGQEVTIRVHPKDLSWAKGTSNINARLVRSDFGLANLVFETDESMRRGTVAVGDFQS